MNNSLAEAALKARAQDAATHIVGGPPDEVVLVQPGTVPKTASGKIRRLRQGISCRRTGSAARALVAVGASELRGTWRSHIARTWNDRRGSLRRMVVDRHRRPFLLGWLAAMTLPRLTWRWMTIRALARAAFAALRIPMSVSGIARIPGDGAVLAFNHASYVDAVVVAAVLPGEPIYVVKKELAN